MLIGIVEGHFTMEGTNFENELSENAFSGIYDKLDMVENNTNGDKSNNEESNKKANSFPMIGRKRLLKTKVCVGSISVVVSLLIIGLTVVAYVLVSSKQEAPETGRCAHYTYVENGQIISATGSKHGDTIEIKCSETSKLIGPSFITCQSTDQWSDAPECRIKDCGPIASQDKIIMESNENDTRVGTKLTVKCTEGFVLSGSKTITCLPDESWSNNSTCEPIDCGSPSNISNAKHKNLFKTTYNSSFSVNCNDGYKLTGHERVKCNANGQWDDMPVCEPVSCGLPKIPANGSISYITGTSFMATVTMTCDEGLSVNGNRVISCQADGNWTKIPSCITDIEDCRVNPCVYGNCTEYSGGYECTCINGYTGPNCDHDIEECISQPCKHGTCMDGIGSYECDCFAGFNGTHCEQDIDECEINPCRNGRCVEGLNIYTCVCAPGFNGINCEQKCDYECTDGNWAVACDCTEECADNMDEASCPCTEYGKEFVTIKGYAIYGYNIRDMAGQTEETCKAACLLDSRCISCELKNDNRCYLNSESPATKPEAFKVNNLYDLYVRKCKVSCTEYGNEFVTIKGYVISGYNIRDMAGQTEETCKAACLLDSRCISCELKNDNRCYLNSESPATKPEAFKVNNLYDLYVRKCKVCR